jgi:hypothetical protein
MPQAAPMKGENRAVHTPLPALFSEQRGLKRQADFSLFSRRMGGRLGEEGRGDEGQPTGGANAAGLWHRTCSSPPPQAGGR